MPTFVESVLNQVKNAWCQIAPQYYLNYHIEAGGESLGFSSSQITAGKYQFQAPGCDPPTQPVSPPSSYPENSSIDVPIYGNMPSTGSGIIEIYYGYNANSYNLLDPGDGKPSYCNVSSPSSNPLGPTLDTTRTVAFPVTAKLEVFSPQKPTGCGLAARLRIKQRTGGDIVIPVAGAQTSVDPGNTLVFSYLDAYLKIPGAPAPPPREPPVSPPAAPVNNYNITWNGPNVEINSPITVKTGPVKVNSDNEFYLTLNVTGGPDDYFRVPFDIQINAKPVFKIGSDNNIKTEINFDIGPDKPEPPKEEPDYNFNGSWELVRCNPSTGELESINQSYSGQGYSGIQSAFNALNTVLGNWQEETIECDDGLPPEPLYTIPMGQYALENRFSPVVTFHFIETRESAVSRGATHRTVRQVQLPVPGSVSDYQDFLDRVVYEAENLTFTGGREGVVLLVPNTKGQFMVNADTREGGISLLLALASICGVDAGSPPQFRYVSGVRFGTRGNDQQLLLDIPMELWKGTVSTPYANYGPTYTNRIMAMGRSRRVATGSL